MIADGRIGVYAAPHVVPDDDGDDDDDDDGASSKMSSRLRQPLSVSFPSDDESRGCVSVAWRGPKYSSRSTWRHLSLCGSVVTGISRWPEILRCCVEGGATLALSSLGAALFYLQRGHW
jgi:hypothetical protein